MNTQYMNWPFDLNDEKDLRTVISIGGFIVRGGPPQVGIVVVRREEQTGKWVKVFETNPLPVPENGYSCELFANFYNYSKLPA